MLPALCRRGASVSLTGPLWMKTAYQTSDSVLCRPFVLGDGLRVRIESHTTGGTPEQLLGDFDIRTARAQQCRAGVAERMPPHLLGNASTSGHLTNSIPHQRLVPVRPSAPTVRAGEDPVARGLVLRASPPGAERSCEERIERNWFLRSLGLARADDLQDDGARHVDLVPDEIDIRPFESEQFTCPQTGNDIKQDHSPLPDIEGAEEHLNLFDFEECRDPLPLGALAHPLNWVAIEQLMAQTVIEEDAHHVADLSARGAG